MFPDNFRLVIDTGVLVSALLRPSSVPGQAVSRAVRKATILISEDTALELLDVLSRPKFRTYIDAHDAAVFVRTFTRLAQFVPVTTNLHACRDPGDDKFLALALSGKAYAIITGDDDLLELSPFQGVKIMTPRQFLDNFR